MKDIEDDVIRRAQAGDADAQGQLYTHYLGYVTATILHFTRHKGEAEDMTQSVMLRVFSKLPSFKFGARFSTWLNIIARREVWMDYRYRMACNHKHEEVSIDAPLTQGDTDLVYADVLGIKPSQSALLLHAQDCINRLPPGQRRAFTLKFIEGYEHHEIAAMLGCTIGNVKSQSAKARAKVRETVTTGKLKCKAAYY